VSRMMGLSRDVPPHLLSFLAFDLGGKRTGVATGNRLTATATAQPTLRASGRERIDSALQTVRSWQPDALVVGLPTHPDGAAHEMTAQAQRFSRQLAERAALPVYQVDERYSSVEAQSQGARDLDAQSACIILEQFFREIPRSGLA
jgi:putative holliday junction resolvase